MLKKSNRNLQSKLTFWYLGSVTSIILIFLFATSGLFWVTLQKQIDHHVHIVVSEAAQIVQQFSDERRQELLTNLVSARGMTIVLLSPDGAPILETNSPDVALVTEHQLQGILSSSSLYDSIPNHFTESGIRFAAVPVEVDAGKGILAVGYSTQVLYSTFTNLLLIVGGIIIFCVLPIAYAGYTLLKKQLQPLKNIALQAKKINASKSLTRRISIEGSTEELQTIQITLNEMLSQLEEVFVSERTFFLDAAHTLKTPLAVLRAHIENTTLSQKRKKELLAVIDSTNDTIQDLLFLSKIGTSNQKKEVVSVTELLKSIGEIVSTLAENKDITVQLEIQPDLYTTANKMQLLRAINNVVHNAVIYNTTHGQIQISATKRDAQIHITISDTGVGVPKNLQKKIFTRFFRVSQSAETGSGLGLSITKAVIEDLGGSVSFSSKVAKGSTVTITLPAT